jgi:hypothetical protein
MAPHTRLARRKARPAGAPSTGTLSRRSATPHFRVREAKSKTRAQNRAAGTKECCVMGSELSAVIVGDPPSLPGLTRQSIPLRKKMDARVKPAHDEWRIIAGGM